MESTFATDSFLASEINMNKHYLFTVEREKEGETSPK